MANPALARYRNIQAVQSGADAFVQATEVTGIDPSRGVGWLLKRLELNFPLASGLAGLSADSTIEWSMTRDSKAAAASLDDSDCVMADGLINALTTSGEIIVPKMFMYHFPDGVVVVEPEIYVQLDSNGTGLTLTGNFRLYYEEVKLSEVDMLRMLTQG